MGSLCSREEDGEDAMTTMNGTGKSKTKKESDIIHFFMLGIEGAGKTTIIRQLKCLCMQKPHNYQMYDDSWNLIDREKIFDYYELEGLKNVVRINLLTAAASLIRKARDRDEEFLRSSTAAAAILRKCSQLYEGEVDIYDHSNQIEDEYGGFIIEIISDPQVVRLLEQPIGVAGLKIEDGTRYFLKDEGRIRNIFTDSYQLTNDDIVHVRKPTVSFKSYKFRIKQLRVEIHDMGGQKSELVKIPQFMRQFLTTSGHCFLLYVSSLAAFQEPDKDSKGRTVLDKSAAIFKLVLEMSGVDECTVMIFFNKQDRFEEICREMLQNDDGEGKRQIEKLLGVPPKLPKNQKEGGKKNKPENYDYLKDSIRNRFKEILKNNNDKKSYYMKYTQATDAQLMSTIFYAVENEIISAFFTQARYL
ncbi:hypothetical protein L3Y34_001708 [Caenorhabditis briggsae]|uniref:Uncharacterized protein n=1 Tax=Caenorhabditis briggsae TaxID=6238 RepID=A0AAE9IQN7_CAEBR|nr:hypothetical protein L3Y34_001708 [Caenorhabditis briggsae]